MTELMLEGRTWCFGDDVDTDQMAPWNTLTSEWDERREAMMAMRPGWVDEVQPGDILVVGKNWGCGSSREQAPENFQNLGIAAVVGESFARTYFRNAIALALPHLVCPGISEIVEEGERVEVDILAAEVRIPDRNLTVEGKPYAPTMLDIVERGGLMEVLKDRLGTA